MIFEDRISTYPNRYRMTTDNGDTSHIILERDDEPVVVGTPLNAETFNGMQDDINGKLPATHINAIVHFDESSDELLTNQCVTWYNQLAPYTSGRYVVEMGTVWFINIYKTDPEYGVFERVQYKSTAANIQYASMFAGNFTGWVAANSWGNITDKPNVSTKVIDVSPNTYTSTPGVANYYILTINYGNALTTVTIARNAVIAGNTHYSVPVYVGTEGMVVGCELNITVSNGVLTFTAVAGTIVHVLGYY